VENAVEVFQKRLPIKNSIWQDAIHENMRKVHGVWSHNTKSGDRAMYTDETGLLPVEVDWYKPH